MFDCVVDTPLIYINNHKNDNSLSWKVPSKDFFWMILSFNSRDFQIFLVNILVQSFRFLAYFLQWTLLFF